MMKEYLEENSVDTAHLIMDKNEETGEVIGFIDKK
jgi:sugar/nucleoside kinase (ribokinase family)